MFFLLCETSPSQYSPTSLSNPATAAAHAATSLGTFAAADQELLIAIPLNVKNQPTDPILISAGGQAFAQVDAKILFRRLLMVQASAFILAHNHPSGDPTPSQEDLELTAKLSAAGKLLDLHLVDHIVLGTAGWYRSIREIINL